MMMIAGAARHEAVPIEPVPPATGRRANRATATARSATGTAATVRSVAEIRATGHSGRAATKTKRPAAVTVTGRASRAKVEIGRFGRVPPRVTARSGHEAKAATAPSAPAHKGTSRSVDAAMKALIAHSGRARKATGLSVGGARMTAAASRLAGRAMIGPVARGRNSRSNAQRSPQRTGSRR